MSDRVKEQRVFTTLNRTEPSLIVINETCVYRLFHVSMAAVKKVYWNQSVLVLYTKRQE